MNVDRHWQLAEQLVTAYQQLPGVEAIAVAGSLMLFGRDSASDIDLYIFSETPPPREDREKLINTFGAHIKNVGLDYWDEGDEWFHSETGIEIDCMYWSPKWIEEKLEQVIIHHQPAMSYTTCFWSTIHRSTCLFDKNGWFHQLKEKADQPYPDLLRKNIIQQNRPLLSHIIPSYLNQIEKALKRGDRFSVQHRLTEFMATYVDVLFAANYILHPGEKRLLTFTVECCPKHPENFSKICEESFKLAANADVQLIKLLKTLLEDLDSIIHITNKN